MRYEHEVGWWEWETIGNNRSLVIVGCIYIGVRSHIIIATARRVTSLFSTAWLSFRTNSEIHR